MKEKKLILTALLIITSFFIYAQELKHKASIDLKNINTVVFELQGNTSITTSHSTTLKVNSYLLVQGKVWGWQFPNERTIFKTKTKRSNDTLFVITPKRFTPKTLGISTYEENIEIDIQIPMDKNTIVRKAENLNVEGNFSSLSIYNTAHLNYPFIKRSDLEMMICKAEEAQIINGKLSSNYFEFQGTGTSKYLLTAKSISISIK